MPANRYLMTQETNLARWAFSGLHSRFRFTARPLALLPSSPLPQQRALLDQTNTPQSACRHCHRPTPLLWGLNTIFLLLLSRSE